MFRRFRPSNSCWTIHLRRLGSPWSWHNDHSHIKWVYNSQVLLIDANRFQVLVEAYSNSYRNMIKVEATSVTTFDFQMEGSRFSDSRTAFNTGTVQDSLSPTTLPENPTITFASPPITPRFSRSLKSNMARIAELQQPNMTDEITLVQRPANEILEALPHQVLSHASNVRSILGVVSGVVNGDPLDVRSSALAEREEITAQRRMVRLHCSHGLCAVKPLMVLIQEDLIAEVESKSPF